MKVPIMTQLSFYCFWRPEHLRVSPCDHLALLSLWMSALLNVREGVYSPETPALIKKMRKCFSLRFPHGHPFVPLIVGGANTLFLCKIRLSLVKPDQNERWHGRTVSRDCAMLACWITWLWYDRSFWKRTMDDMPYIFCKQSLLSCTGTTYSLFMEIKCRFKDPPLFMRTWLHSFQRHLSLSNLFIIRCWIDSVNSAKASKSSGVCPWQIEAVFREDCLTWKVLRLHDVFMC